MAAVIPQYAVARGALLFPIPILAGIRQPGDWPSTQCDPSTARQAIAVPTAGKQSEVLRQRQAVCIIERDALFRSCTLETFGARRRARVCSAREGTASSIPRQRRRMD